MSFSFTADNPFSLNNNTSSFATGAIGCEFDTLTANSIPFVLFSLASGCTVTSLTDSASNTWTIVEGASDGTWTLWAAYCNNPSAYATTDYVTFNFSNGPSSIGCYTAFGELVGGKTSAPLGTDNSAEGSSTAPSLVLSGVSSGSCIVAYTMNLAATTPGIGSGYTGVGSNNGSTYGWGYEYNLSSASGSVTVNFTGSVSTWNLIALAFSPSVSAGTKIYLRRTRQRQIGG